MGRARQRHAPSYHRAPAVYKRAHHVGLTFGEAGNGSFLSAKQGLHDGGWTRLTLLEDVRPWGVGLLDVHMADWV